MTTTEHAAEIRKTLKQQYGWTSRDVSVRAEYYSMGSSLHVIIKRAQIPFEKVNAIAMKAEKIDRDQFGDILAGGNTYVHVKYSRETLDVLAESHREAVNATIAALEAETEDRYLLPIAGTPYRLGWTNNGRNYGGFSIWNDKGHCTNAYNAQAISEWLGCCAVNRLAAEESR